MKPVFKILVFIFLIAFNCSCRAQMVQTIADAKKLEINEKQFTGKPLKTLLQEIKPEIKRVAVSPGGKEFSSFFVFYFQTKQDFIKSRDEGKQPTSIRVYVKDSIDYKDFDKSYNKDWWKWDANDVKKYGNFTVRAILVSGKD